MVIKRGLQAGHSCLRCEGPVASVQDVGAVGDEVERREVWALVEPARS